MALPKKALTDFMRAQDRDTVKAVLMDLGWLDLEDTGPSLVLVWQDGGDTSHADNG